jgi:hypothetical protein
MRALDYYNGGGVTSPPLPRVIGTLFAYLRVLIMQ